MALAAAVALVGIAIFALSIYGADIAVTQLSATDEGFLPFDAKVRGMGLGIPGLVLPFVAFAISLKEPSRELGAMIIITGVLILVGGAFILGTMSESADVEESSRNVVSEAGMLIGAGAIQIGLGVIKIKRS